MKNLFRGAPWPASTIAIISILFTPAVGGIVAGINQHRMGFPRRAWLDYFLSRLALIGILLVAGEVGGGSFPFWPLGGGSGAELLSFIPFTAMATAILALPLFFGIFYSFLFVAIVLRQRQSSITSNRQGESSQIVSAYILAILLTLIISLLILLLF